MIEKRNFGFCQSFAIPIIQILHLPQTAIIN